MACLGYGKEMETGVGVGQLMVGAAPATCLCGGQQQIVKQCQQSPPGDKQAKGLCL